nr:adenylyl-sulfate kinase [Dechloromonas sp.]
MSDDSFDIKACGGVDVVWHHGSVVATERQKLLGQRPATIWLTGLSGAGKSTLATSLERLLMLEGRLCCVLDGDNIRHGLNRDLGFSPEDRGENIRRVAEVARLMNDVGIIVIAAFISPYRSDRAIARDIVSAERFVEVFLDTPLAVCEERDPKGFYRRARQGAFAQFTGVDAPYEAPLNPALSIDTSIYETDACVAMLARHIRTLISLPGSSTNI